MLKDEMELCRKNRPALVIAGPTASGKSGLALAIAKAFQGVIINADSMQVYDALRILTARPDDHDMQAAPHRLYGVLPPSHVCSAAEWRDRAAVEMQAAWDAGHLPILVGGTGLYLRTLMQGISPIPDIPDDIRQTARAELQDLGNDAFHQRLTAADPIMGQKLHPGDSQRMVRAWEVLMATGHSLSHWHQLPWQGAVPAHWLVYCLDPPRPVLAQRCDQRFRQMVQQGALQEVAALLDLALDPSLPIMKALGVPELADYLRGACTLEQAERNACLTTRHYAKRQATWFRHQLSAAHRLTTQFSESDLSEIFSFIRRFLLTPA